MLLFFFKTEKRFAALPTSPFTFMKACMASYPRDYFNLELRHHQILFIAFIA